MHQKTLGLEQFFNGLVEDFMVRQVEPSKCKQVDHINSSLGSVLLVCTLADRRLLDVFTLQFNLDPVVKCGNWPEPFPVMRQGTEVQRSEMITVTSSV